jgi:hypothetical protein
MGRDTRRGIAKPSGAIHDIRNGFGFPTARRRSEPKTPQTQPTTGTMATRHCQPGVANPAVPTPIRPNPVGQYLALPNPGTGLDEPPPGWQMNETRLLLR